ncbi:low-density lipoprotein receptor-related protein 1B isoform X2 [Patella vulgata]|uniref:low-density lipoprotein receptor-related protein 1B isoform X2 n=1 Tax=Patella vulgata TaxID=6465 RepID=UPI0021804564|nr:low-density lipoprotein receptor-related protein 1B isoform X2 [Patella vulgata]
MKIFIFLIFIGSITISHGLWWPILSEDEAVHNCTDDQFPCKNNQCINKVWVCDNYEDCPEGEDEKDCTREVCPVKWFNCDNGRCIDPDFNCDGVDQCSDGSDEQSCSDQDLKTCVHSSFKCAKDDACIPSDFVCDGSEDCLDGSDEKNCGVTKCERDQFLCVNTTLCIARYQVCDDVPDCADGSDENRIMCHNMTRCESKPGYFMCTNSEKCLDVRKVCDDKIDCLDESDEPKNCSSICKELKCEQGCAPVKGKVTCVCMTGYQLNPDNKTCNDIDECNVENEWGKKCSQNCSNSKGSYSCNCIEGYDLEPDYHTCKAKGEEPILFYSTRTSITRLNLRSRDTSLFRSDLSGVSGIATDSKSKTVFWSSNYDKKVYKSRVEGRVLYRKLTVISVGLVSPVGLGYDWIGENLYIIDTGRSEIIVCKPDGDSCTVILSNLTSPTSIVVDSHNRNLYFTETGSKVRINKSWLDGRNNEPFVTVKLGRPTCLVVDYTVNRLYWADTIWNRIERIDLDGKNRHIVLAHEVHNPSLLVIFEDTMMWSDSLKHTVMSGNKFMSRDIKHLVRSVPATTAAAILHTSLQTQGRLGNSCLLEKCSHMCLLSNTQKGYSCACPQGYQLMEDQRTCERKVSTKILLVAQKSDILQFSLDYIGSEPFTTLSTDDEGDLFSLGYDPISHHVIHSTLNKYDEPVICQTALESNRARHDHDVIASGDIKKVASLAVDWVARNVFWVDSEKKTLEVARLDRKVRAVLLTSTQLHEPRALALHPQQGTLFISDWGEVVCINKCDMDGKNCYHLITRNLGNPNSLTVDENTGRLYWTDARLGEIVSVTVDGEKRITHTVSTEEPLSLTIADNIIYWSDWKTDSIHTLNLTSKEKKLLHRGQGSLRGLTLVYDMKIKPVKNQCSTDNGGCSHICLAKHSQQKTCRCPKELKLDDDGKTCVKDGYTCKEGETKCRMTSSCLKPEQNCDDKVDCPNKIDELNCAAKCSGDQFRCTDGKCIPPRWMCDGSLDCINGTDEVTTNCVPTECNNRQFRCTEYMCILKALVCDHYKDCPGGEDEKNCMAKCPRDDFQCTDGSCIDKDEECDGSKDCQDGSDENMCNANDCLIKNGDCSHKCETLKGKVVCYCRADYELSSDNKTCLAKGVRPYLLVANDKGIHRVSTNGQTGQTDLLISTTIPAIHVDIISKTGDIIWSTFQHSSSRSSIHATAGNQSHVLLDVNGYIGGLAVDWISRTVYYTNYFNTTGDIGCCNIDKIVCSTLSTQKNWAPTSIAVYPSKGKLYWIDNNEQLVSSWMDGSNRKTLTSSQIYGPVGLSIDYVKDRIYWVDSFFSWIKSVDLNGDHKATISGKLFKKPSSLDVFESHAYITDSLGISKIVLITEDHIRMTSMSNVMGVKIVHPIKQSPGPEPCRTAVCQFMCISTPAGAQCLCPDNYSLNRTTGDCFDSSGIKYMNTASQRSQKSSVVVHHDMLPVPDNKTCILNCMNGGYCQQNDLLQKCVCLSGYNGTLCELNLLEKPDNTSSIPGSSTGKTASKSKLWILGVVLGAVLIICFVSGLAYYLRSKNKDLTLVSMIKYRNPNLGKCEEVEELVSEISFNNPGFQDCDDKTNYRNCRNLYENRKHSQNILL